MNLFSNLQGLSYNELRSRASTLGLRSVGTAASLRQQILERLNSIGEGEQEVPDEPVEAESQDLGANRGRPLRRPRRRGTLREEPIPEEDNRMPSNARGVRSRGTRRRRAQEEVQEGGEDLPPQRARPTEAIDDLGAEGGIDIVRLMEAIGARESLR